MRAVGIDVKSAEEFLDRTCEILTNSVNASLIRFERFDGKSQRTKGPDGKVNGSEFIGGDILFGFSTSHAEALPPGQGTLWDLPMDRQH